MRMKLQDGLELVRIAKEKIREEKIWQMWLAIYPNMTEKNFIPFEQFNIKRKVPPKKNISSRDEVLKKVERINKAFAERGRPQ